MKFFLLIIFALSLSGCRSEETSPLDISLKGDIVGQIYSYGGQEGFIVSINGLQQQGITDERGKWIIHDVPTGIYTITFKKEGYASARIEQFQFVGGGVAHIPPFELNKLDTAKVRIDSIRFGVREGDSSLGYDVYSFPFRNYSSLISIDRDSIVLATDPSSSRFVDKYPYNQYFYTENNHCVIHNGQIKYFFPTIQHGEYFYVAFGFSAFNLYTYPIEPLTSGRFFPSFYSKDVTIIKLQYRDH